MISVLLSILKILGIVLLVLLGILLVFLLLILFVPVRYKVSAERDSGDEQTLQAQVKITWLFHILNMLYSYPDAAYLRVRVFIFTVFRSDQEKKSPDKKKVDTASKASEENKEDHKDKTEEKEAVREDGKGTEEHRKSKEILKGNTESGKETPFKEPTKEEPNRRSFFEKLFSMLKNIKYTIIKIYDKIKHILKNIEYYLKVIRSETFQRAFGVCSEQTIALLNGIKPKKLRGNLVIGTGDPASTGQILAVYGMLYPVIGDHINITPDFERQIVEGNLLIKGRITAWKLLKTAWKVYFNRDIRRVIKLLKREEA